MEARCSRGTRYSVGGTEYSVGPLPSRRGTPTPSRYRLLVTSYCERSEP